MSGSRRASPTPRHSVAVRCDVKARLLAAIAELAAADEDHTVQTLLEGALAVLRGDEEPT